MQKKPKFIAGQKVSQSSDTFSGLPKNGTVLNITGDTTGEGSEFLYELDFGIESEFPFVFREDELSCIALS